MAIIVNTNMASLQAQNQLARTTSNLNNTIQQLSSGLRVNSAADDASGYAISKNIDSVIKGSTVAIRNANDGISFSQTATGALEQMSNTLARMRELAVQSASDSNGVTQNALLDTEFQALNSELTRLRASSSFNGIDVFSSSTFSFQITSGTTNNSVTLAATPLTNTQSVSSQKIQAGTVTTTTTTTGIAQPGLAIVNAMDTAAAAGGATLTSVYEATVAAVTTAVTAGRLDAAAQTVVNTQLSAIKDAYAATTQTGGSKPAGSVEQMVADFGKVLGSAPGGVYSPSSSVAGPTVIGQTITQDRTWTLSPIVARLDNSIVPVEKGIDIVNAMYLAQISVGEHKYEAELNTAPTYEELLIQIADLEFVKNATIAAVTASSLSTSTKDAVNSQLSYIKDLYAGYDSAKFPGKVSDMVADFVKVIGNGDTTDGFATTYVPSTVEPGDNFVIVQDRTYPSPNENVAFTDSWNAVPIGVDILDTYTPTKNGLGIINAMYTESSADGADLDSVLTATTDAVTASNLTDAQKTSINSQLTAIKTEFAATTMTDGSPKTAGTVAQMLVDFVKVVGTGNATDGSATTYTPSTATPGTITISQPAQAVTNTWTLAIESDLNVTSPFTTTTTTTTTRSASENSLAAINVIDTAIIEINTAAASNGAFQNRLGITISNLSTLIETTTATRSRSMDTDFAAQTAQLAKYQILQQAGTAMLAQANQMSSNVLTLLK
jgi:flagellin